MKVLITYDISFSEGNAAKRLRHIAKACQDYGTRVQYSVFECDLSPSQWVDLQAKLLTIYNDKTDSLRFYMLGSKWHNKIQHFGAKKAIEVFTDTLIV